MKSYLSSLLFFFSVIFSSPTIGQNKSTELGGKLINEIFHQRYGFGLGMQLIRNLDRHFSFETGLYYKGTRKIGYYTMNGPYLIPKRFNEKTIMTPLICRFNTRVINLSAGGTIAFILNYKQTEKYTSRSTGRLEFSPTVGISKSFKIGESWIMEPEIRCSSPIPNGGLGTALNLALRKRLKK